MGEAIALGAVLGTLLGSMTLLFQGELIGIPLGAGFGFVYGIAFGLGGWLIGWLFFNSGVVSMKGSALGWESSQPASSTRRACGWQGRHWIRSSS